MCTQVKMKTKYAENLQSRPKEHSEEIGNLLSLKKNTVEKKEESYSPHIIQDTFSTKQEITKREIPGWQWRIDMTKLQALTHPKKDTDQKTSHHGYIELLMSPQNLYVETSDSPPLTV